MFWILTLREHSAKLLPQIRQMRCVFNHLHPLMWLFVKTFDVFVQFDQEIFQNWTFVDRNANYWRRLNRIDGYRLMSWSILKFSECDIDYFSPVFELWALLLWPREKLSGCKTRFLNLIHSFLKSEITFDFPWVVVSDLDSSKEVVLFECS